MICVVMRISILFPIMVYVSINITCKPCQATCDINAKALVQWHTYLQGFQVWSHQVKAIGTCAKLCVRLTMCLSFNFDLSSKRCDLNNATLEDNTDRGVTRATAVYSRIKEWPETLDPDCHCRPCQPDEVCVPSHVARYLSRRCLKAVLNKAPSAPTTATTSTAPVTTQSSPPITTETSAISTTKSTETVQLRICEGQRGAISCADGEILIIEYAYYGRWSTSLCPYKNQNAMQNTDCHLDVTDIVTTACAESDSSSCEIIPNNALFGQDPCGGTYKYVKIGFTCQPGVPSSCPDGWLAHQQSCYQFNTYQAVWNLAAGICQSLNAYRVQIDSQAENEFLKNKAQESRDGVSTSFWTGGNDIESEGNWVWGYPNGKTIADYVNWYENEPNKNHDYTQDEDCLAMYEPKDYKWVDAGCNYEYYFICEKESARK